MTNEKKKIVREKMEREGWHRYGIIDEDPDVLLWNKEMEIMYENMDGEPCQCKAIYQCKPAQWTGFIATTGPAKGNYMGKVFAYREIKEESNER